MRGGSQEGNLSSLRPAYFNGTQMTEQIKPPVNHDDWTPLPDSWRIFRTEFEIANMLSNSMLEIARRSFWKMGLEGKGDVYQVVGCFRYSQICSMIMKHRGLEKEGASVFLEKV